jgi:hypothetical protein
MPTGRLLMRASALSVAIACACASSAAAAANFDYEASLGVGHTDNVQRTSADENDESIGALGLRFSLDRQGSRLEADAVGNLSYLDYLDDTYDSEVLGNFAGNARLSLVPQRFEWLVEENFGQALTDPFSPATPDNRENINYFSTGPEATFAFGSQMRLRLGGRYSLTTYEDRPLDSDGVSGQVALIRQLSPASTFSLNGQYLEVSYDTAALNADYEQRDAFVRYDITGARTFLAIDAGYSEVEQKALGDSQGGLLLRLQASRRLSAASTATLRAGREFSNSGSAFANLQNTGIIGQEPVAGLQTAQPFTNDYLTVGWQFSRNRTAFDVAASRNEQTYENASVFDQTFTSFSGQFSRNLSPLSSLSLFALYSRGEFRVPDTDYEDLNAGISMSWRVSGHLSLGITYDYFDRSSDMADGEYAENRYWLSISYGRGSPRDMLAGPGFGAGREL